MNEFASDIVYVVVCVFYLWVGNEAVNRLNKAFTRSEKKKDIIQYINYHIAQIGRVVGKPTIDDKSFEITKYK